MRTPPPTNWSAEAVPQASAAAVYFAYGQVGKRYCWGGTGPDCFDCSGLVQAAWRSAGVKLPRTAIDQGRALADVSFGDVRPGDILWWPHHVGLYIGGGEMIDAYHSRAGVVRRRAAVPVRVLRVLAR
jgi:cell wall-associated NlpC family hydrolase